METFQAKIVNRAATVQPAAVPTKTVQSRAAAGSSVQIQMATKVSSPHDPAEKEAESTAKKIMRMTISEGSAAYKSGSGGGIFRQIKSEEKDKKLQTKLQSPYITRFANSGIFTQQKKEEEKIQRKAEGQPQIAPNVTADIQQSMAGGYPLPPSVRRFMEPRFRANFSQVKVHTNDKAAKLNQQLNARAFTMGNHLFFGKEQFKPESREGKELIAHELTHTIQQGEVIQRSEEINVTQQAPVQVQRWGLSDALNYFADKVYLIPGFRMFTLILGVNPINMSRVDRSAANILRALVEFIPGGALITQALDNYGIFDKIGNWVEQQIKSLGIVGSTIKQAITGFLDSLSWKDILDLGGIWNRAKPIFTEPIDRIISFAKGLATGILQFIKDAVLRPLAKLAEGTRGYDLLKAVLGKDPVTGDPVPRTADTLIGGFMKLIGQEEVWNNLKKANAVAHAWAWFQGAMSALMGFVGQIPTLFIQAFKSLQLEDIILLPRAFAKVGAVFGKFIGNFMSWAGNAVWNLLEIIFAVVAPGAIPYLKKAGGAFRSILKNPISFVGNLVQAGKRGFLQFADNIGKHLKTSLIQWLTGTLVGVYLPQSFEIREIIKFVLSVLNLTWQTIRQKLVRVVGEPVVTAMETNLDIVITLVKEGPAAAWEKIKEQVMNLKEIVIEGIMGFVTSTIVQNAVTKLVSMLNPAGVIIQAILAVYNTIMFFVERLKQIAQVAMAFLDSISAIAAGVIAAAAGRVEQTLAGSLTLAISFLARFAGLGKVGDAVMNIIKKLQVPIDKALDAVVGWVVGMAKKAGKFFIQTGKKVVSKIKNWWNIRREFQANDKQHHALYFRGEENKAVLTVESNPTPYEYFLDSIQDFINRIQVDEDKTKIINARIEALQIAKQIDALKNDHTKLNDEETEKKLENISKLIKELQNHTKCLFREDIPDSGEPKWAPYSGVSFGKRMYVKPLTNKAKAGSAPHEGHDLYDKILNKRRQAGGASYYIRGHLLNEKLGGPGKWNNMTPLSREGNSRHEKEVESKVKVAVNSGAIVEYIVDAIYGRTEKNKNNLYSNIKTEDDNKNKEDKVKIVNDIIKNERYVPTKLKCEAYVLNHKYQRVKKIVKQEVENPVEQERDKYYLEGNPKPQPIYLNKRVGKSELAKAIATVLGLSEMEVKGTPLITDPETIFRNYEDVSNSLGKLKSADKLRQLRDDGKITLSTKNEEED